MMLYGKQTIDKNVKAKQNKFIDYSGLFFIGILSLGYLLYYRSFAKLHINLSFIKAPFFIGDMTFVICGFLFFIKWLTNRKNFNIFTCLFLFYTGFVVIKTLVGYINWGPLSLRHAVLFCYPLFAIFNYSFYRIDFFEPKKAVFFVAVFISIFKFFGFHPYFNLTLVVITLILINVYPIRLIKYILYFLLLLVFPYKLLFNTSRTFMISNFITIIYMSFGFLVVSKINKIFKFILFLLVFAFLMFGLMGYGNEAKLRSLVGFEDLKERYGEKIELLSINSPILVAPELITKLYNDNETGLQSKQDQVKECFNFLSAGLKNVTKIFSNPGLEKKKYYRLGVKHENENKKIVLPEKAKKIKNLVPDKKSNGLGTLVPDKKSNGLGTLVPDKKSNGLGTLVPDKKSNGLGTLVPDKKSNGLGTLVLNKKEKQPQELSASEQVEISYVNSLFRIFVWKDAINNLLTKHPVFGFDFGNPFRSYSLEVLGWARSEWARDGWICFHNSYLDIIYRAGLVGILVIFSIFTPLFSLIIKSFKTGSFTGILLTGVLINWFIAANFLEILEMPYSAIPIWSLFGLTSAYLFKNRTS